MKMQFASDVYRLLDEDIDPQLSIDDLEYLPIEHPFEQYIINLSKDTYLNYSYFDTSGEISRYSSLMPWHLFSVRNAMLREINNPQQIIDLTAHIGVDSVNFSILYPNANIISVEYDLDTFLLLRDNLLRYAIILNKSPFNLSAYHYDATKILDYPMVLDSNVAYLDPPWQSNPQLYLGDMKIEDIIIKLLQNGVQNVILKAPPNYELYDLGLDVIIHQYKIYTKPKGGKLSYVLYFFRLR
jgi:hypothetical protein